MIEIISIYEVVRSDKLNERAKLARSQFYSTIAKALEAYRKGGVDIFEHKAAVINGVVYPLLVDSAVTLDDTQEYAKSTDGYSVLSFRTKQELRIK